MISYNISNVKCKIVIMTTGVLTVSKFCMRRLLLLKFGLIIDSAIKEIKLFL